ncbi:MAG: hypothetical protein B6A08_12385 [Sorangiineae bacterium NIC37A_2]|jgi:LysM repeat protein|nr:MAG: hypothetical protein B6A08_12385 [Sorangiineae bacterium NIC37A_2]
MKQLIRQNTFFCSSHPWAASGILALASLVASVASAQDGQQTGGAEVTTGGAQSPVVSASPYYNPNVDLEKINSYLPSSSRPIVDGREQDGFDLNRSSQGAIILSGQGAESAYGEDGAPVGGEIKRSKGVKGPVPEFHTVKKGDTLWQVSQTYYQDPHEWPRLWSLNPQLENPHWIYPGDQLRTAPPGGQPFLAVAASGSRESRLGLGSGQAVPPGTIFLRDQGYIGDPEKDVWGELVGAREDRMMLSEGSTVYMLMNDGVDLRIGQRLSVFRDLRPPAKVPGGRTPEGRLVKVYGTVRIDGWNEKERVARGQLIESLDVVERGLKVGPVGRRFDVVPPKPATAALEARVLMGIHPHVYFGQNQVVFIDRGSKDGLVPGNRLRAVTRGDIWRRNLRAGAKHQRLRAETDLPEDAPATTTPLHGDDEKFPDEVIGEVTVIRTEEETSLCLVSESSRELVPGERLEAVAGY